MKFKRYKRKTGIEKGTGKYAVTATYKGKRGYGDVTFMTKKTGKKYIAALRKSHPGQYKNPRLVKL